MPPGGSLPRRCFERWGLAVALLLFLWMTRLPALDRFPLHIDEGVHITRALKVWEWHPFWAIGDGRIINHWPIAALYPQNAPAVVARIPTALAAMIGLAAGYALVKALFGGRAAALAGAMWLASPYLLFYERLALSDAQAGALVVAAAWASVRLAKRGRARDAALTGVALASATMFKFTAVPYALMTLLVVLLMGRVPWRRRWVKLGIVGAVGLGCFAAPLLYLALRGGGELSVVFRWLIGGPGALPFPDRFTANLGRLWGVLWGYGALGWALALLAGLAALLLARSGARLLLGWLAPFLAMTALGSEILPRHYVAVMPLALTLAGAGLGAALDRLPARAVRWAFTGAAALILAVEIAPFAAALYRDPASLALPDSERIEYVTAHSAGFGLREAVQAFPETIQPPDAPVIASMFPDSCRRANFYAAPEHRMVCTDAPGLDAIRAALSERGLAYVLIEAPPIGLDVGALDLPATRIAGYPRPGETEATASVTLWRLEAPASP